MEWNLATERKTYDHSYTPPETVALNACRQHHLRGVDYV